MIQFHMNPNFKGFSIFLNKVNFCKKNTRGHLFRIDFKHNTHISKITPLLARALEQNDKHTFKLDSGNKPQHLLTFIVQ